MTRTTRSRRTALLIALSLVLVGSFSAPAGAAEVVNGGFESGSLSGWTTVYEPEGGGEWLVYSGTPVFEDVVRDAGPSPDPFFAPPTGTYAAVTVQESPSRLALYQDVALASGQGHFLRMYVYYRNQASGGFVAPDDFEADPNQQYRIDVMNPSAPVFSTAPTDVRRMLFRTDPGEPNEMEPTLMEFDLSEFAGQTIRLRFVVMVTEAQLHGAVDAVQIISGKCKGKPATAVGTDGDDSFTLGTPGKDVILGLEGDDVLKGGGKKDVICGGPGNDDLIGGAGNDLLIGGPGKDDLNGKAGNDTCKGGGGRDEESSC